MTAQYFPGYENFPYDCTMGADGSGMLMAEEIGAELKNITSSTSLSASLKSMLQLSADIGVMANRILEMGDLILARR